MKTIKSRFNNSKYGLGDFSVTRTWQAAWIWPDACTYANAHVLFQKKLIRKKKGSCHLYLAAESFARVYINGKEVHRFNSLSYPSQQYYEEIYLENVFKSGINEISILVRYIGMPTASSCTKDPGTIFEFHFDDGETLFSDTTWHAQPCKSWSKPLVRNPWLALDLTEICDHREFPKNWPHPASKEELVLEPKPYANVRLPMLEKRCFPFAELSIGEQLKIVSTFKVVDLSGQGDSPGQCISNEDRIGIGPAITTTTQFNLPATEQGFAWVILFDLGGYSRGYPHMNIVANNGTIVDIAWAEELHDDRIDFRPTKIMTADRHILADGQNEIYPEDWMVGRYLQLTFRKLTKTLNVKSFQWITTQYPLSQKVFFKSTHSTLNRIFEIAKNSVRMCMHENIMDCPWRERRQWIADVQRIALSNHYLFKDRDLVRAVLRQHTRLQDASGRMWPCTPLQEEFPIQSMAWVRGILEYEMYTGDTTLIKEVYHNIYMLHKWFMRCRDRHGCFAVLKLPVNQFVDNAMCKLTNVMKCESALLVMNLEYMRFLDDIQVLFKRGGDAHEAKMALEERKKIDRLIRKQFYDPEKKLLRDGNESHIEATFSEMGHALAVLTQPKGIDAEALWDRFRKKQNNAPHTVFSSDPFAKYLTFEAMAKMGREAEIIPEILKYWGPMVEANADCSWERFDGASRCHGWGGIVIVALCRHVLKIKPHKIKHYAFKNHHGIQNIELNVVP